MINTFYYSILKYSHNQASGEVVNLGILFCFPGEGHFHFSHPDNLKRLKYLFEGFNSRDLQAYLKSFNSVVSKLGRIQILDRDDFSALISERLLTPNGSSLYFSKVEQEQIYIDVPQTILHYNQVYLEGYGYQQVRKDSDKHDERYILHKYKELLSAGGGNRNLNLFYKEGVK